MKELDIKHQYFITRRMIKFNQCVYRGTNGNMTEFPSNMSDVTIQEKINNYKIEQRTVTRNWGLTFSTLPMIPHRRTISHN